MESTIQSSSLTADYFEEVRQRIAPVTFIESEKNVLRWNEAKTAMTVQKVVSKQRKRTFLLDLLPEVKSDIKTRILHFITPYTSQPIIHTWNTVITPLDYFIEKELNVIDTYTKDSEHDELARQIFFEQHVFPRIQTEDASLLEKTRFLNQPFFHWNNRYTQIHTIIQTLFESELLSIKNASTLQELHRLYAYFTDITRSVRDEKGKSELNALIKNTVATKSDIVIASLNDPFALYDSQTEHLNNIVPMFQKDDLLRIIIAVEEIIYEKLKDADIQIITARSEALAPFTQVNLLSKAAFQALTRLLSTDAMMDSFVKSTDLAIKSKEQLAEPLHLLFKLTSYYKDKDILIEGLHGRLSRRLLSQQVSPLEEIPIRHLKMNLGMNSTFKMETMLKDITVKDPLQVTSNSTLRLLNMAAWNLSSLNHVPNWNIPSRLSSMAQAMLQVEKEKKITFLPAHDTIQISARFGPKTYQITMTSIQASVIFLLDEKGPSLTTAQIAEEIGAPPHITSAVLHSLTATKTPLLRCQAGSYQLLDTLSTQFISFKIPSPPFVEKKDQLKETVEVNRTYAVEAAIVRIMKARKELAYQDLVGETIRQLSYLFQADPKHIKRSVETLIDREYLERVPGATLLRYLA